MLSHCVMFTLFLWSKTNLPFRTWRGPGKSLSHHSRHKFFIANSLINSYSVCQLGCIMPKCVFGHMWTVKAWISQCICAVWTGPSPCADSLATTDCFNGEQMPSWNLHICAGWCESTHFALPKALFTSWCGPIWKRISKENQPIYHSLR